MRKSATAIIAIALLLITAGIIMLFSTSAVQAEATYNDPAFFLKRQVVALIVGFIAALACMRIPYPYWRTLAPFLAVIAIVLLVMALIPGVGVTLKGSSRWLRLGPFNLQPSEIAKFVLIIGMARWLSQSQRHVGRLREGLFIPLAILGSFAGLVFISPDFGTTMLMGVVGFAMMYIAGARLSYLIVAGVSGAAAVAVAIMHNQVRMRRILAFLDPEKYAENEAYQLTQAIYAFVIGGFGGVGLGESLQKRFYLPEAHTDFIFAILGEEFGLRATLPVLLLFAAFFFLGLFISRNAPDPFAKLLAFGITMMISFQAAINIGVVTGSLPTKGLALPFISYGGTSLVMSLVMVGVLVNIAFHASEPASRTALSGSRTVRV
ncbi:MAG TPA: putative lipid II flippase FtsW [Kiritimatiellia bacterium]|nr:putative lipid II flippase FtsW [Kiritimatiellia bacterium]HMO99007.1 putative lipid II flippase FtsW [Kiritimatiellia bacterium]HMP95894.1 putative lipid II flippase FtsW [Kiritimatiellia bacterium]